MALLDALHDHLADPILESIVELDNDFHADVEYSLEALTDHRLKTGNDQVSHLLQSIDALFDEV